MIQAVIFDMDGIIIDSEPLQMVAINQVLSTWGIQLTEEDFIPMIGRRLSDDWENLKKQFQIPIEFPEFVKMKNEVYQKIISERAEEMPGLTTLLQNLRSKKIVTAVASGSIREDIEMILDRLKIQELFDSINAGDEVAKGKPDPEIYLLAARRLGVAPEQCVAVEDTTYGVTAAKSAGMRCIAMPHLYTRHQDFSRADLIINSLSEITPELLRNMNKSGG